MKTLLVSFSLLFFSFSSFAQANVDSVKAVINNMFIAMKTSDSKLLRSCFADTAVLQTIQRNKAGNVRIKTEVVNDFASFLDTQEKGIMDEQITFDIVKIDADLASVWTPYKFFYKGKFSHCGVNSFQLVRINNIWKIQYLIDTRRLTGCE